LVDWLLDGEPGNLPAELGTVVLTLAVAAFLWRKRPGAFAKRRTTEGD
jgi:hypothetical protein